MKRPTGPDFDDAAPPMPKSFLHLTSRQSIVFLPLIFDDNCRLEMPKCDDGSFLFPADSGAQSPYLIRFLLLPLIRSVLSNMWEMEEDLRQVDDINWTVVRPPGLKNMPSSGKKE